MLSRLADVISRRPRRVLLLVVAVVIGSFAFGGPVLSLLTSGSADFEASDYEAVVARERIATATGASPEIGIIALVRPGGPADSTAGRAEVERIAGIIQADPGVAKVVTAFDGGDEAFISNDGESTYLVVSLKPQSGTEEGDTEERIHELLEDEETVQLGGPLTASREVNTQVGEDLAAAEKFAVPILLLLSIVFFRSFVAALLPFAVGLASIGITFLLLRIVNEFVSLSIFAVNLVTGLGIGLAFDYALFIVWRYREEIARSGPGPEALRRTLETAGRTVAFSALTVAAGLGALLAFPQRFLYSMGFGGIFVALASAAIALTLLPTLLAMLGTRVNSGAPKRWKLAAKRAARADQQGFWYRLAQGVMQRALLVAILVSALLLALALPFLRIEFAGADASSLPPDATARVVRDAIRAGFDQDRASPIYIAVDAPDSAGTEVEQFAAKLRELPSVAAVSPTLAVGNNTWRVDVFPEDVPLADSTKQLVEDIRAVPVSFAFFAGGEAANFQDQQTSFAARLPIAVAIAVLTTLFLLFLLTGSLVLPFKTVLINILSISAVLGFLVLVFQDGRFESVFDYVSDGALNSTQPILIGAIAFALSTDYAIFLLTRIKEAYDEGVGNTESVAIGLERTGRIVTAAAVLLAIAIGAFTTSEILLIKQLGLGVAFAVLLDATVVRAFLVPSLMKLLGAWNWWAPTPLRRLHDRIGLRESS